MVCVSVPFTELHEHAYTILLLLWYKCVLFTNLLQGLHSHTPPSFVCVSHFISELHEHVCSLLWCEKVKGKMPESLGSFSPGNNIYTIISLKNESTRGEL